MHAGQSFILKGKHCYFICHTPTEICFVQLRNFEALGTNQFVNKDKIRGRGKRWACRQQLIPKNSRIRENVCKAGQSPQSDSTKKHVYNLIQKSFADLNLHNKKVWYKWWSFRSYTETLTSGHKCKQTKGVFSSAPPQRERWARTSGGSTEANPRVSWGGSGTLLGFLLCASHPLTVENAFTYVQVGSPSFTCWRDYPVVKWWREWILLPGLK